ncbi:MAG: hypothetical protein JWM95_2646 [Gemmatimonadetes bacterium]|nr:hypothetical protein [Gemmatimonadota bacterium]
MGRYVPTFAALMRDDTVLAALMRDDTVLATLMRDDTVLAAIVRDDTMYEHRTMEFRGPGERHSSA